MAPTIITIAPGIQFEPGAAASFRRFAARLGRTPDVNSTYRDYDLQMSMFRAWNAWVAGRGPKPNHSRAVHPDESDHCKGIGWDSDEWTNPAFVVLAAEYGWIRTAANDPTERHHFTYQWWRDQHRNDPIPAATPAPVPTPESLEEIDMQTIYWNNRHVFTIGRGYLKHETNKPQADTIGWLFNRNDRMAKNSMLIGVDDKAVNALQKSLSIPWYAFELVLSGRGYNIDGTRGDGTGETGRVWSFDFELSDKIDGIRLDTSGLAKSLEEVLSKAG